MFSYLCISIFEMPWTSGGRYYKIVDGKRVYQPSKDRRANSVSGRGSYRVSPTVQRSRYSKNSRQVSPKPKEESSGSLGRMLLTGAGTALGGLMGGPAGALVGNKAADLFSTVIGLGDYTVKMNALIPDLPVVVNPPHPGETTIRHREYLGDIITSSVANTFNLVSYPINAARAETFPFLSQLAQNYEQYRIEGMLFEFRSMSADALNSTNTALGSVIMATNYNAANANFASKAEMENYEFGSSCKPSVNMIHPIECARIQTTIDELYCRPGAVPSGQDQRLYDLGNFQIATTGFQGTSVNIGELWVTYQVGLLKPKLFSALGGDCEGAVYTIAAYTDAAPLGTTTVRTGTVDSIGLSISSTVITLPASNIIQYYQLIVMWTGGGAAVNIVYPVVTVANGTISTSPVAIPAAATSTVQGNYTASLVTAGNGLSPTITFGVAGTLPSAGAGRIYLLKRSPSLLNNS